MVAAKSAERQYHAMTLCIAESPVVPLCGLSAALIRRQEQPHGLSYDASEAFPTAAAPSPNNPRGESHHARETASARPGKVPYHRCKASWYPRKVHKEDPN